MLIFIQRGTSVPFFLRFFRGFAPFRRFGTAKDSRFGCRRVTADSSGLPLWCGERLLRQGILTVLSLYSSVECAGVKRISFCCSQKERNAVKTKSVGLSCRLGAAKDSRFGCRRVTADSSGLPLWCGERLLRQGILTVLSLYSSVECAGVKRICFCCGQKERNAAKTKSVGLSAAFVRRKAFTAGDFDRFKCLFFRRVCRG